jgi:outer membrane protein assembly factor BamB
MHARVCFALAILVSGAVGCATSAPSGGSPTAPNAGPVALSPSVAAADAPLSSSAGVFGSSSSVFASQPPIVGQAAPAGAEQDWLTYQHDPERTGQAAGSYAAANTRPIWDSPQLDGEVYGQVLVFGNHVFVVTENNSVYALDAGSGSVVWAQHLGDPVPRSALPCGNIDPTGITSTPVIDPASGLLFAVDFLQTPPNPHHELVALDTGTGAVQWSAPIDPPNTVVPAQQQRAALLYNHGTIYVPFGGLFGDCGQYHGYMVAASAQDGSITAVYQVPTQREGAIWAAPSMSVSGDIWAATGNGSSTTTFDYGDAVLHLSPSLQLQDYFAPQNWLELNRADLDLGSTGPVPLDNDLVFSIGKGGDGYLLQADNLGQIGGQLAQSHVCNGAYGGSAHTGSTIYMACRDGLAAIQVEGQSFSVTWRGPQFYAGAPTIAGDAIWTLDDGGATLYALNPSDGSVMFQAATAPVANPPHFLTPTAAGGNIYQSRGTTISAYSAT